KSGWRLASSPMEPINVAELTATGSPEMSRFHGFEDGNIEHAASRTGGGTAVGAAVTLGVGAAVAAGFGAEVGSGVAAGGFDGAGPTVSDASAAGSDPCLSDAEADARAGADSSCDSDVLPPMPGRVGKAFASTTTMTTSSGTASPRASLRLEDMPISLGGRSAEVNGTDGQPLAIWRSERLRRLRSGLPPTLRGLRSRKLLLRLNLADATWGRARGASGRKDAGEE